MLSKLGYDIYFCANNKAYVKKAFSKLRGINNVTHGLVQIEAILNRIEETKQNNYLLMGPSRD